MPREMTLKGRALLETLEEARRELDDEALVDALKEAPYVARVFHRVLALQLSMLEQLVSNDEPCWKDGR